MACPTSSTCPALPSLQAPTARQLCVPLPKGPLKMIAYKASSCAQQLAHAGTCWDMLCAEALCSLHQRCRWCLVVEAAHRCGSHCNERHCLFSYLDTYMTATGLCWLSSAFERFRQRFCCASTHSHDRSKETCFVREQATCHMQSRHQLIKGRAQLRLARRARIRVLGHIQEQALPFTDLTLAPETAREPDTFKYDVERRLAHCAR